MNYPDTIARDLQDDMIDFEEAVLFPAILELSKLFQINSITPVVDEANDPRAPDYLLVVVPKPEA